MITDKDTDFVYFSSLIKELDQYTPFWKRLNTILTEKKIKYGFIENTRDIWCRDYMPIQLNVNQFVQFEFFPDYYLSPQYISKLTIPSEVRTNEKMDLKYINLIIDGGNFIKSTSDVILTEKVLKENHKLSKESIITLLKKEIHLDNIYLIPQLPYDMTGHADGMVRFISNTDLLVADYSNESKSWRTKMDKALDKTGLNIIQRREIKMEIIQPKEHISIFYNLKIIYYFLSLDLIQMILLLYVQKNYFLIIKSFLLILMR